VLLCVNVVVFQKWLCDCCGELHDDDTTGGRLVDLLCGLVGQLQRVSGCAVCGVDVGFSRGLLPCDTGVATNGCWASAVDGVAVWTCSRWICL
jgi:hypothetical protein